MPKIEKLLDRLKSKPKDLEWSELRRIMAHFGYEEIKTGKTSGSREGFFHPEKKTILRLDKPHNPPNLRPYQVIAVLKRIKNDGYIK